MANIKDITKDKAIQIKVTEEEYNAIKSKADSIGYSISAYVRLVAINGKVEIKVNPVNLVIK